jgi:hypothetical protein
MKPPIEAYRFTSRLVPLDSGLHGIRYLSQGNVSEPPAIMVQALPVDANAVDYLPSPGGTPGCLVKPGEMLVLRAHRRVHVVATIVSTSPLGNPDSLQLRVEHLDRAPGAPRKALASPRRAALSKLPNGEASAKTEPRRLEARSSVSAESASVELVEPTIEVPISKGGGEPDPRPRPADSAVSTKAAKLPGVTFGLLAQGARSWRAGALDEALRLAGGQAIVGVRAAMSAGGDPATQLRLHVRMSDGRLRESMGRDVRVEAVGRSLISETTLQYRNAATPTWTTVLHQVFDTVA